MMRQGKEFSRIGDALEEFAGVPGYRVTGILAPTGTALDLAHVVRRSVLSSLPPGVPLQVIDDAGALKFFYGGDMSILPENLRNAITKKPALSIVREGKNFAPIYIGSTEAAMMREKKLFRNPGDRIEGFFGNDVYIAGVLPETGTVLDQFHFIPAGMRVRL